MEKTEKKTRNRKKIKAGDVIIMIFCLIMVVIMLVPFVWMLSASFKSNAEIMSYPVKWIPEIFRTMNYEKVWSEIPFLTYYLNTLKLAVIITAIQVVTSSLSAFAFTKLRFPGRDKIFIAYLATMMIPWHAIMIPQFIVVKAFGLYNSHGALIATQAFSAFGVFLLRQNMMSVPDSLHEAAKIDGCSTFQIYLRIVMPMIKGGISTLIILTFNSVWNDYLGPLIYLDSDRLKTIQVGLASFQTQFSMDYGAIMAGTVCAVIPIVIVYAIGQKQIVESVSFSGLKG